ncbi:peptidase S8 and S53, subtilisin, kexin, sedolisin [Pseudolabrys taiwanensis]|uniref:Peptidase S8 and S53, subtilisin, kexin, sedolisin n=1 Tax=Pseudolabrys taiwanensis TaxID=331696 RepID=A0A345ZX94_9HYPH|nr:S8 family peptidase [Pseudolabrys taiwanensis]AXK81541.1 peptidase S8 and S53, subtilisin, kexin, sedolisin [Pseudolabrys taiwanensis]
MTKRNFLLGKGERLVEDVAGIRGGGPKYHPYTFSQAKTRLAPMLSRVVRGIDQLPDEACPNDQAVATVTLNPEYIAKSYFPDHLLRAVGLEPVGSRPRRITPEKRSKDREPEETITTELFVMGSRSAFRAWRSGLPNWHEDAPGAAELATIEQVAAPTVRDKIKGKLPKSGEAVFEVVLHTDAQIGENRIVPLFREYLEEIGLDQRLDRRFYAGGLCFVELEAPVESAEEIATFTPVRALRQMPALRMLRPTFRSSRVPMQDVSLPTQGPVDPKIRAAIFDGGIPKNHPLTKWAKPIEPPGIGKTIPDFQKHGVAVTSSFLFGHIDPAKPISRPFAPVDHYRVLDATPGQNPHELYEVLDRIDKILVDKDYEFVNFSIGPRLPIEDDDVHAWTAVIDDRLSRGKTLATIAVGNDGDSPANGGLNRIQVPADCVNALAVGACDNPDSPWQRCAYSSVGPGRSPGLIKPDFVEFGGCLQRPFIALSESTAIALEATEGTSFSAPSALRLATGVRAHFGANLNALAIRALLIHTTEACDHPCEDVGRGRVARSVQDIVLCDDDTVRVVYQGNIAPSRYIRAPIPVPSGTIPGKVQITATLCYATGVDPHHPGNYTRAGLEAAFRPHDQKRKSHKQIHADTKSFFGKAQNGLMEDELRRDAWKWENCLHGSVGFQGKSLRNPVFDIHYNARLGGRNFAPDDDLAYALVITVEAKHLGQLYDDVVRKYANLLEPLRPVVDIPITT